MRINKNNCMKNRMSVATTTDMGITNLGKYILPKMCALAINVDDVFISDVEKKLHKTTPDE